ncbi:MAG: Holliday junction resolvase RuvX [Gemmatimonadota bacterium]|nr:MAG: Holliday junction resolvase RuvX [Gemmatimonadota bacterium]
MSRVLAIDYGERRIGVAVSDPTRTIAQPLPTLVRRRGRRPPYARLLEIVAQWEVACIVVGLPIETSGTEGHQAREVRAFGEALGARTGIPVRYWDERLSSVRAKSELASLDLPAKARRQKERVDAMAAMLILQEYLDAQGNP